MGMYTELLLKTSIKRDLPEIVAETLNFLFNDREKELAQLPDHKFFTLPRWEMIGSCSSYYHIPWSESKYAENYLFSRSDLKNYDGEIEAFIDWIMPYIDEIQGQCIGWQWYEEDDIPTLLVKK